MKLTRETVETHYEDGLITKAERNFFLRELDRGVAEPTLLDMDDEDSEELFLSSDDKPFNQAEMNAYNEAFDCFEAFLDGAPKHYNPYRIGAKRHAAWKYGWDEAVRTNAANHKIQADVEERRNQRDVNH